MRRVALLVIALLPGTPALADDAREALAREIEAASATSRFLAPPAPDRPTFGFRHRLDVEGCDVTAETQEIQRDEERTYWLTFDLHRTRLPDPDDQRSAWSHVFDEGGGKYSGTILFSFVSPHAPRFESEQPRGWTSAPNDSMIFPLDRLSDDEAVSRLVALLRRYQAEYCTLVG